MVKELLHIQRCLSVSASMVVHGKAAYDEDPIAQEAGESVMMNIGEAFTTLVALGATAPPGVRWSDAAKNREKIAHHYSVIVRELTWRTLAESLPRWEKSRSPLFEEAGRTFDGI
ncbi:HepT-like ribonuclease domain-containing protein [Citricoccus muralis]|uniref:DUF86 domain-containing protein n=1 Tax=Citricoccus muralis TaxID=169134 RepID=A0ABY8H7X4_9MICC|nr:HepT-like ribonuclease domain-containing protein [Citricoccus muralis]WFP16934.1 hypothetical protein P8192_02075 [Citricoccus muralis]